MRTHTVGDCEDHSMIIQTTVSKSRNRKVYVVEDKNWGLREPFN